MKKLDIRWLAFWRSVWSYTWRWMLILLGMLVCCYYISTLVGFIWWILHEQSGAVKIIFQTVVIGFMCAALQIFVGMWIYQYGRKKLIKPLEDKERKGNCE